MQKYCKLIKVKIKVTNCDFKFSIKLIITGRKLRPVEKIKTVNIEDKISTICIHITRNSNTLRITKKWNSNSSKHKYYKCIRLAEKDIEDLDQIIPNCNKTVLNNIIEEILKREDLFESKKTEFERKLKIFKEKYNV